MKVTARNKRDGKYSTMMEYRNSSVSLAEEIISELSREEKQSFGIRKRTAERVILLSQSVQGCCRYLTKCPLTFWQQASCLNSMIIKQLDCWFQNGTQRVSHQTKERKVLSGMQQGGLGEEIKEMIIRSAVMQTGQDN